MTATRTQHKCNVCGEWFVWGEQSKWFGSIFDEEEGTMSKVCSDKCKATFDAEPGAYHLEVRHHRNPMRSPKILNKPGKRHD